MNQASPVMPELAYFEANLPRMVAQHRGQYVLIRNGTVEQYFGTYEEALTAGYERFGLDSFFVKRVSEESTAVHYTRDLGPWRV